MGVPCPRSRRAEEIKTLLNGLRGRPLYPVAVIGLAAGARRGELLALRWSDVDLDNGRITIERSLEQTNAGLNFKPPKTKAGRRTVSVPPSAVSQLRTHWKARQEKRLALGLGGSPGDGLVFARQDGSAWPPDSLSSDWAGTLRALKLPRVTLHALRHTHVSQLIASGLDVVTVSRRIGHSKSSVTLNVYAHLFGNTDERASTVIEAALVAALTE